MTSSRNACRCSGRRQTRRTVAICTLFALLPSMKGFVVYIRCDVRCLASPGRLLLTSDVGQVGLEKVGLEQVGLEQVGWEKVGLEQVELEQA